MDNLLAVATQVGILFALMSVGFACRKARLLNGTSVRGLVDLLVVIVTPAIVLHAFERPFDPAMCKGLGFVALAALLGHIAAIVSVKALLFHKNRDTQNVLRLAAVFSNAGFMGIPLDHALFGEEGVFYGVVYVGVFNVVMWSWGYCTIRNVPFRLKGMTRETAKSMFVNPGTIGLALGLPVFFASWTLPPLLHEPVKCLADLNTPLAMIVIGYYLAGAKLSPLFKTPIAYAAVAFRLVVFPLLLTAALWALGRVWTLDRTMMLALVVGAAAPVAALTSMLSAKYHSDVDMSVGLVSGTTLLSILTMPLVIALAMAVL